MELYTKTFHTFMELLFTIVLLPHLFMSGTVKELIGMTDKRGVFYFCSEFSLDYFTERRSASDWKIGMDDMILYRHWETSLPFANKALSCAASWTTWIGMFALYFGFNLSYLLATGGERRETVKATQLCEPKRETDVVTSLISNWQQLVNILCIFVSEFYFKLL